MTTLAETALITGEELFEMGDIGPCELIDGRIVPMSPVGGEHADLEFELGMILRLFVRQRKLGWVIGGEVGIYIRRNPDRVRGADIAFFTNAQLPKGLPKGFIEVAPVLVVEIVSPNDRWEDIRDKLADYFSIGVERVWIVEPKQRTVLIYASATQVVQALTVDDTLRGEGVLIEFALPLRELFPE